MKKILVPVDFSEYSEYALEVAATIAHNHDAELIVLHMMGLSQAVLTKDENRQVFEAIYHLKLAEKRFADLLDKDYLNGLKVTDTVQNYKSFNEINEVAEDLEVDLIVMGSHGTSGLEDVFVGSNTEKVVRTSNLPVLVVKQRMVDFKINNAVFACDFAYDNIGSYIKAMHFFSLFGANVKLLYINLPGEYFRNSNQMEEKVLKFLNRADLELSDHKDSVVYYSDYSVERGIFNYSNSHDVDAIALPTHGRRGLAHFFTGSIGESVVNHSEIPVITFKIEKVVPE